MTATLPVRLWPDESRWRHLGQLGSLTLNWARRVTSIGRAVAEMGDHGELLLGVAFQHAFAAAATSMRCTTGSLRPA